MLEIHWSIKNIIVVFPFRGIPDFLLVKFAIFMCHRKTFKYYVEFYVVSEIFIALAEIFRYVCRTILKMTMKIQLFSISTFLLYLQGE